MGHLRLGFGGRCPLCRGGRRFDRHLCSKHDPGPGAGGPFRTLDVVAWRRAQGAGAAADQACARAGGGRLGVLLRAA
jgi:hypothetical protein